jgi:putative hydrolase of the HAD superfamily
MIEAAMTISNNTISIEIVEKIIQFGKELLQNQSFGFDGVEET